MAGATSCTSCPAGQYEFNLVSCKDCRAGKFSNEKASTCIPCGSGKVSARKSPVCTVCEAGQYASHADNKCKPCPRGKFSQGPVDSCSACPAGTYSGPGGSQCSVCVPGQYYDATLLCIDCVPSFYSTNPNMKCTKCPRNKYSSSKAISCLQCAKGLRVKTDQSGCESATTTPPPTFAPTSAICKLGTGYDDVLKKCVLCLPGFYNAGLFSADDAMAGSNKCSPCGRNSYTSQSGAFQCDQCSRVVNANKTACAYCEPSFFQRRYLQNTPDYFSAISDVCLKCPEQTYISGTYQTYLDYDCRECPSGSKVKADQTGCEPGPIIPITDPPVCGPGLEYDVNAKKCVGCKFGYSKQFSFQSCTRCIPGHYAEFTGSTKCYPCGRGGVVGPDRSYCKSCNPSFYTQTFPVGDYPYTNDKESVCVKCPKGTYTPPYGHFKTSCETCPSGQQVNDEQTGCGKPTQYPTPRPTRVLRPCVPGEETDYMTKECTSCDPGSAPFYVHECWPCRAGTYAPDYKSAYCAICPITKVVRYRTECVYCEPSFYRYQAPSMPYPNEVEATCRKCPAGQYSGFEDSGCHDCAAGSKVNALQTGCTVLI